MAVENSVKLEPGLRAVDEIIQRHNAQPGGVMGTLQELQDRFGYVPPLAIERIAESTGVPAAEIYGIATFYAQFRLRPLGKNVVKVCHGTACHLNGADNVAQAIEQATGTCEGETSADGQFTVERVACLGCCSLAPCVMVNGEVQGRLAPESIAGLVKESQQG